MLIDRLGFRWTERVEIPGDKMPKTMELNDRGNVEGDKFELTTEGLRRLSDWFAEEPRAESSIRFDFGYDLENIKSALRAMT